MGEPQTAGPSPILDSLRTVSKQLVKTNVQLVREAGKIHSVQAAAVAPEVIDLRNLPKHASEGAVADRWKRDAMTNLVHQGHKRLREVKKEREEALLDVEDQEENTSTNTVSTTRFTTIICVS